MIYVFRRWRDDPEARRRRLRRSSEEISGYARSLERLEALTHTLEALGWERIKPTAETIQSER